MNSVSGGGFGAIRFGTFVLCCCLGTIYGQIPGAGMTGFHLAEEPISARAIACGGAGAVLEGKGFAFYNPAALMLSPGHYLSFEYGQYPQADMMLNHLEGAVALKRWRYGGSIHSGRVDGFYPVDFTGGPLPDFSHPSKWQFTQLSVGASYMPWPRSGVGITLDALQDRLFEYSAYAFSAGIGFIVYPLPRHLVLGGSVTHIRLTSTPMSAGDSLGRWGHGERLPLNARFGFGWRDTVSGTLPVAFYCDAVYRNVYDRTHRFRRDIRRRLSAPVGCEVSVLPGLQVRIGKRINIRSELLTCGIGLQHQFLSLDASFAVPSLAGDKEFKWLAGVTFSPSSPSKRPASETHPAIPAPPLDTVVTPAPVPQVPLPDTSGQESTTDTIGQESLIDTAVQEPTIDTSGQESMADSTANASSPVPHTTEVPMPQPDSATRETSSTTLPTEAPHSDTVIAIPLTPDTGAATQDKDSSGLFNEIR